MQRTVDSSLRGRRRRAVRPRRARADRRRRPFHRQAGLRARRPGRDRAEQGRPAQARPHRDADADRVAARRLPCAPSGQREDRRRRRRAAGRAGRPPAGRARATSRPTSAPTLGRGAGGRARAREGAPADARGGAARAHRRGRGAGGEGRARATIFVETESQKQILVGKGGAMVREIGTRARPEIEALLGHPVFLELHVKVASGAATSDAERSAELGADARLPSSAWARPASEGSARGSSRAGIHVARKRDLRGRPRATLTAWPRRPHCRAGFELPLEPRLPRIGSVDRSRSRSGPRRSRSARSRRSRSSSRSSSPSG